MKPRETLDEAIDRIASCMTQGGDASGVAAGSILARPAAHSWMGWRVVGVAGMGAVLLALAIIRTPGDRERVVDPSIATSPLIAWSPLRSEAQEMRSGEMIQPAAIGRAHRLSTADRDSTPSWGIPFLETPAAIAVTVTTMSSIDVAAGVGVEAIEVAPLSVDAIDRNSARDVKEQ